MQGALYTRDFLERGITEETAWTSLSDESVADLRGRLSRLFEAFTPQRRPVEGVTEEDLIYPVLEELGWADRLVQQQVSRRRRDDVPDALLFADADKKRSAIVEKDAHRRYRHGLAIVEAKRWLRPLDRADAQGTPSSQMLRYLRRAEEASDGKLEWGILTNGRIWRLYWQGARSRAEEFLELDLPTALGVQGFQAELLDTGADAEHWLKVFVLMFRRQSFLPPEGERESFHARALKATRRWEAKVAESLSGQVFDRVFPALVNGIAQAASGLQSSRTLTPNELDEVRRAALTLLYRLLFVLYAEDRRLLPVDQEGYAAYSLDRQRSDIAERIDRNDVFSDRIATRYETLRGLFAAIDRGDPVMGLPPYNGGLFDLTEHLLLEKVRLPDSLLVDVIDALSRREEAGRKLRINYRDLSVQQLGSIYERLLEFAVVPDEIAVARIQPDVFARKGSGSYYTPEELVRLIIERTIGPLLEERQALFDGLLSEVKSSRKPKADRLAALLEKDPATAFLNLRVCDPAMGSGHFLVSLVDFLADRILGAMAGAEIKAAEIFGDELPYRSPLQARIESIRSRITARAKGEGWRVSDSQLDDRHIIRRMILKRVVYGVDKNPMAVELAKVSLWLHTFTVGAPLSFLDHHLRCGDSLFGEFVRPVEDYLLRRGSLALVAPLQQAKASAKGMAAVEEMSDADIAEVERSQHEFAGVAAATQPLNRFLDFFQALRWLDRLPKLKAPGKAKKSRLAPGKLPKLDPVATILDGALGDPVKVVAGGGSGDPTIDASKHGEAVALLEKARQLASRERFLHWQAAFPGVWDNWESAEPAGGFDAVIGNPPWDRIKLQEVEWFASRRPEIAMQQRASDRARMIAALKKVDDPLYRGYRLAVDEAESMARVAREQGTYPLLSGGDINLYSLFIERAQALIRPTGVAGLLVPSGIAADKSASDFFGKIATEGRLVALLDFENRRYRYDAEPFFPDVDTRFKFCAFVTGGKERRAREAACAFFLQASSELFDPQRSFSLTAQDFARFNPNTKTAPILGTRRDVDIARGIYSRLPVLNHHAKGKVWPVEYFTMFHMTNDAGLFRTRAELDKDGVYPVEGGALRKGSRRFLPLYEGKMVQLFDHRAASVVVNLKNLNRPAQTLPATDAQHADPTWTPTPQFWVDSDRIEWPKGAKWAVGFKDVTAPTNVRTMIAALIPESAVGNTLPLVVPDGGKGSSNYSTWAPLIVANLNSFAFDFAARQKVQGQHLNWFIVEQIPIVPPKDYEKSIGKRKCADLVRDEVLHLTYAADDMRLFAEDMGHHGRPFQWDEEDRRHRRARLDAIFFHLYGLSENDVAYILDAFPIVREEDEAGFSRYRTKEMIIAYMRAFAAGDTESRVSV